MINIIGLGYIGLPTALMFAKSGSKVVGTDINANLVDNLNNGILSIKEDGMEELFNIGVKNGIVFTTEYQKTNTYIITVPTPYESDTKKINVEFVLSALKQILDVCLKETVIVIESTISPGTIEKYVRPILKTHMDMTGDVIEVAHAPERIIPGNMVYELENNSRTIGSDNESVASELKKLYSSFCKAEIVITDIKSAEMSKVVENTFRDINIAFANELAKLCNEDGMDVYEIIKIANKHPRVNILQPGPGVGGHCIPVDPWFLVGDYPNTTKLIKSAREVNESMPYYIYERIKSVMKTENINEFSKVGLYGLSYKENIDDVRESPTLQLIDVLNKFGIYDFIVYDPLTPKIVNGQKETFKSFVDSVEMIVILVGHDEIKRNYEELSLKVILDTKSIFPDEKHRL